jgi:hypothetical protein
MKAIMFAVCSLAACVVVAASEETSASSQSKTNPVPAEATITNIVGVVYGDETNVILRLSSVSGRTTSTIIRVDLRDVRFDEIITVPAPPPLGDFWLRGEFEGLLEQKRLERRQKKE